MLNLSTIKSDNLRAYHVLMHGLYKAAWYVIVSGHLFSLTGYASSTGAGMNPATKSTKSFLNTKDMALE